MIKLRKRMMKPKENVMEITKKDVKIEIKVDEAIGTGTFSNFVNIGHSPEEFVLDFLFVHMAPPPGFGKLVSRIILTPGHAKRLVGALSEQIGQYEDRFGPIAMNQKSEKISSLQ
jgi:hypothetical protein